MDGLIWTSRRQWWERVNNTVIEFHPSDTSGSSRERTQAACFIDRDANDCAISLPPLYVVEVFKCIRRGYPHFCYRYLQRKDPSTSWEYDASCVHVYIHASKTQYLSNIHCTKGISSIVWHQIKVNWKLYVPPCSTTQNHTEKLTSPSVVYVTVVLDFYCYLLQQHTL